MKYKKGIIGLFTPLIIIFAFMLVLLLFIVIFKNRLVEVIEALKTIFTAKVGIILLVLTLVLVFRKFVMEVLMTLWKFVKGVLRI